MKLKILGLSGCKAKGKWLRIIYDRVYWVSGVENSISAFTALVTEMDTRETVCEDGRGKALLA
jgi:hypothetical protein